MAHDNPHIIQDAIRLGLKAHQLLTDDPQDIINKVGPDQVQAWRQALTQAVEMAYLLSPHLGCPGGTCNCYEK